MPNILCKGCIDFAVSPKSTFIVCLGASGKIVLRSLFVKGIVFETITKLLKPNYCYYKVAADRKFIYVSAIEIPFRDTCTNTIMIFDKQLRLIDSLLI